MEIVPCPLSFESQHSNDLLSPDCNSFSSQLSLSSLPSLSEHHLPVTHHQCISTLKGHSSYSSTVVISGKFLYSGSSDSDIRIWSRDPFDQQQQPPFLDNSSNNIVATTKSHVKSLLVSENRLFSAHQDNKIRVWQINDNHQNYNKVATLPTLTDRVTKILPSSNYVQVRRHKKCTWVHHVDAVSALVMSSDGSLLYSASWDRSFKIWRTSDFKCLESIANAHDDAINAISLSHTGFVYTGSADKTIKVWRKLSGDKKHSLVAKLEKHKSAINALALSIDETTLYSGACDRSIVVWEKDVATEAGTSTGHMVLVGALRGHTKAILCLAIVSDLVCSGSADKTIRIWRRNIGSNYTCLAVIDGHKGPVKCLSAAIDHYGSNATASSYLVYSGSLDSDIKVWQISVPF